MLGGCAAPKPTAHSGERGHNRPACALGCVSDHLHHQTVSSYMLHLHLEFKDKSSRPGHLLLGNGHEWNPPFCARTVQSPHLLLKGQCEKKHKKYRKSQWKDSGRKDGRSHARHGGDRALSPASWEALPPGVRVRISRGPVRAAGKMPNACRFYAQSQPLATQELLTR